MPSSVFGIDDRIEKEGDEIRKVIGMKMGKQNMRDLVPIHTGFDQVHQRARAKIQDDRLIRPYQIPSRGTRGMHVGSRTENS